ncbi:MAG TPA: HD domain-containing protein [Herpetosiphonaceae bacterium]
MATLGRAIAIAAQAHQEQRDKAGAPYILHPLRMMAQMRGEDERIVAVLHDLIEDTEWTLDQLRAEGFSDDVLEAIDCLTRRDDESYEAFIERASHNELARKVKLADLEDNMDLRRIAEVTDKDLERLHKYHRARQMLLTASEH